MVPSLVKASHNVKALPEWPLAETAPQHTHERTWQRGDFDHAFDPA